MRRRGLSWRPSTSLVLSASSFTERLAGEEVQLEGFHCADCAQTIEKTVAKVGGVRSVKANFAAGKVSIVYDGARVARSDLVRSVEKIGYRVTGDVHRDLTKKRFWKEREFQYTFVSGSFLALGLFIQFFTEDLHLVTVLNRPTSASAALFLVATVWGAYHLADRVGHLSKI